MTQEFADKQIRTMRAVLDQLQQDAVEVVAAHDAQLKFDLGDAGKAVPCVFTTVSGDRRDE